MKQADNIEKLFSDALKNYEAPVDPAAWQAVQSGIQGAAGSSAAAGGSGQGFWSGVIARIPGGMAGLGAAVVGTSIIIGSIYIFSTDDKKVAEVKPGVTEQAINPVSSPEIEKIEEN